MACLSTWEAKRGLAAEAPKRLLVHETRKRVATATLSHFLDNVLDPASKYTAPLLVMLNGQPCVHPMPV